jgi:hypothetical protein
MIGYFVLAGAILVGAILISEAIKSSSLGNLRSAQQVTEELEKLRHELATQIWHAANPNEKSPSKDGWWTKTFDHEEKS